MQSPVSVNRSLPLSLPRLLGVCFGRTEERQHRLTLKFAADNVREDLKFRVTVLRTEWTIGRHDDTTREGKAMQESMSVSATSLST